VATWSWVAAGMIALALVGRGIVGAGLGLGNGAPSAMPTSATMPDGTAAPVTSPESSGSPGVDQPASVIPTVDPSTPPTVDRVILPRVPTTSATPSQTSTGGSVPATSRAVLQCAVRADVRSYWSGYNAALTIGNTGRTQINGWVLTFSLPEGQTILNSWSARFTVRENRVWASDAGFNATLSPGGSTQIGYRAHGNWSGALSGFALNGVACTG
jgi:hypothetical protein